MQAVALTEDATHVVADYPERGLRFPWRHGRESIQDRLRMSGEVPMTRQEILREGGDTLRLRLEAARAETNVRKAKRDLRAAQGRLRTAEAEARRLLCEVQKRRAERDGRTM